LRSKVRNDRPPLSNPVKIWAVIESELQKIDQHENLSRHSIVELWPEIVKETIARHSRAEKVSGETLYVVVDSSAWMNELSALKNIIISKVNEHIAAPAKPIRDIKFRQRSWLVEKKATVSRDSTHIPPVSKTEDLLIKKLIENVTNEELRKKFSEMLEKDRKLKASQGGKLFEEPPSD
jgi:hypothetical protein